MVLVLLEVDFSLTSELYQAWFHISLINSWIFRLSGKGGQIQLLKSLLYSYDQKKISALHTTYLLTRYQVKDEDDAVDAYGESN